MDGETVDLVEKAIDNFGAAIISALNCPVVADE
jgi:hypothetical protein